MRRETGQTISEYIMAGGLIAVVAIGAVTMFSGQLAAMLPGLLDSIFNGGPGGSAGSGGGSAVTTNVGDPAPPPTITITTTGGAPVVNSGLMNPVAGEEQICFQSGMCLNVPEADTETAGGLGGNETEILASILDQIALQLLDSGADPSLVQAIEDLANQGHSIGDEERNAGHGDGYQVLDNIQGRMLPDFANKRRVVNELLDQYGYGDAEAVINWAADNIEYLANGLTTGGTDGNPYAYSPVSGTTHVNANTICSSGGTSGCMRDTGNGYHGSSGAPSS